MRFSIKYISKTVCLLGLILEGCCPKDPSCTGQTSLMPSNFWQPTYDYYKLPCAYDWDTDIESAIKSIKQPGTKVTDLINVALLMNPTTQQTWANARAAAYNVEVARSALYPNVNLSEDLNASDTRFDDGPPLVAATTGTTTGTTTGNTTNTTNTTNTNNTTNTTGGSRGEGLTSGRTNFGPPVPFPTLPGVLINPFPSMANTNQVANYPVGAGTSANQLLNVNFANTVVANNAPNDITLGNAGTPFMGTNNLTGNTLFANNTEILSNNITGSNPAPGVPLTAINGATGAAVAIGNGFNAVNNYNTTNLPNNTNNTNNNNNINNTNNNTNTGSTNSTTGGIGSSRSLIQNLSVSYLLLDFGGREANIEAAKQALYNSDWTHNRQIQQVIVSVLQAYYNYEGLSYLLVARQSDLQNAKTNFESARALFEAGLRTKLDVLQAQSDLVNIELNIVNIEGQKRIAYGTLANAMGLPANTTFNVPEIADNLALDVISQSVEELIDEAKERRPDLAAAYALHEQRKAEITIARSAGLPTLGTQVNLQEFNDLINPSFNTHTISGSLILNVPLFSGFLYVNQEREAREILRSACANLRNTEINISLDVLTSYYNFKTAVKSLVFSAEYLKFSEEAYESAFVTYREGIGTILDLLNAQRTLANARAQKIQARTNWAIALSNISFTVGTTGTKDEIQPWKQYAQAKKH